MDAAPHIVDLPAQHSVDRRGALIVAIVAHGTGGRDSRSTLQTGDGRGVSIHTLHPKNGTIYRMVPDERGANHAGAATSSFTLSGRTYTGSAVNVATLGFELENMQDGRDPYTDAQLLSMGWQIIQWRQRFGALPVLRHADLDPSRRRDPYHLSTDTIEHWVMRAAAAYAPPAAKRYRARHIMISQRQEGGPPYAGELAPGDEVTVDKWYTNNLVHLADGRGFVKLSDLEEV